MEGFTFASALDLNMSYYHIKLDADANKMYHCIPMGKMQIKYLTMGIKIAWFLMYQPLIKSRKSLE
jgi:hypothetical protein